MDATLRSVVLALIVVAIVIVAIPFLWMVAMMVAMGGATPFGAMGGAFWPMLVLWSLVLVGLGALLAWAVRASTRA